MGDLISRAAARDVINTWARHEREDVRMVLLHNDLNAIPAVDAAPVRHGQWAERRVDELEDSTIDAWQSARCMNCGKYHTTPYMYSFTDYQFCPHCGAKMDGDDGNAAD